MVLKRSYSNSKLFDLRIYTGNGLFIQPLRLRSEILRKMSSQSSQDADCLMDDGLDGKTLFGAGDGLTYE